jgi:hypothetical protein
MSYPIEQARKARESVTAFEAFCRKTFDFTEDDFAVDEDGDYSDGTTLRMERCWTEGRRQLESDERDALTAIRDVGHVIGCGHTDDPDGRQQIVTCVRQTIERLEAEVYALKNADMTGAGI